ncbi:MAG: carboxylating nicotinate-nucleotide diphosphorylase [Piscirickettsiaceae bacterium]|nr:carboxylating nicotinate-nucleotide diphosphorylase [Piscirickettsiaceae bacterium]
MTIKFDFNQNIISDNVTQALKEDIGAGDLTASLIPETSTTATIISREKATLSGVLWVNEVFAQLSSNIKIIWFFNDGDRISENDILCELTGPARQLLSGERVALNFLQTLSGTASLVQNYADTVVDLDVKILDTRKTIPGLRIAQKYAVRCGGGHNHRVGLYDGILIKENHILATGSIIAAIASAQKIAKGIAVEVEVENFDELEQALIAQADIILLDNFDVPNLIKAVEINQGRAKLEASGGITLDNVRTIAETGVDQISIGALTKDIRAIDLSMRFI